MKKTATKPTELVQAPTPNLTFTEAQVELIRSQIAPKATDDELKLFLYQAQRTGLDPLARQIYMIHRKTKDAHGNWTEKATIQTSIDGFRVVAERTGKYAGQDEPAFDEDENGRLKKCVVAVYKFSPAGERYLAAYGVAYWDEYVQTYNGKPSGMWEKMPHNMLSKVAEALALRKAFPQDLSGLYTSDEMVDNEPKAADDTPPVTAAIAFVEPAKITHEQQTKIDDLLTKLEGTLEDVEKAIKKPIDDWSASEADKVIATLKGKVQARGLDPAPTITTEEGEIDIDQLPF